MSLKLDWCDYKSAKWAVEHWHYSKRKELETIITPPKHRYLYPLDDKMKMQIEKLRQPYPKRQKHKSNADSFHESEGGAVPTLAHQKA